MPLTDRHAEAVIKSVDGLRRHGVKPEPWEDQAAQDPPAAIRLWRSPREGPVGGLFWICGALALKRLAA